MSKRISQKELYEIKRSFIRKYVAYSLRYWSEFDYTLLGKTILSHKKAGRGDNGTYNDVIIMCDTETSKAHKNTYKYVDKNVIDKDGYLSVVKIKKYNPVENYIVAWTISLRAFNMNLVTLYGTTPEDFCECLALIQSNLSGHETYYYWHNLSYDYCFIRKFMFSKFGHPDKQLNTKPHYPILIAWNDEGIIFKDSLILSQRTLERWAEDLKVPHAKAVGKWDYNKIRKQRGEYFTSNELDYIECDTLAGVECIDETMKALKKRIYSMPYTATGIPREEARKLGKKNRQRDTFLSMVLTYEQYIQATRVYHGGYTHANRFKVEKIINNCLVVCRDFSSSYPFVMLSERYPMESFDSVDNCSLEEILEDSEEYAFMFKLILVEPRLKDPHNPMPALQFSKCVECINPVVDNGRILCADYVEIYLNEIDAKIIHETYKYKRHLCVEVYASEKGYLPRWFTDYVYTLYYDKCTLKNADPVLYAIQKAKLNSLYGMCVMKAIRDNLQENFVTGDYENIIPINPDTEEPYTEEELYRKYVDNNTSFLPYQWGVWVTSFAMYNLFTLSKCCVKTNENGTTENGFLYSDTDSIYSTYWNEEKVKEYNDNCLKKLHANGYDSVVYEDNVYTLGVAEVDGVYSEFRVVGAKRYCCRYAEDPRNKKDKWGKLKITVAGVPKDGVKCLNDDINNFTSGFIFSGEDTGKLTHHYIFNSEIRNEDGITYGDSIDLTPCDYLLSSIEIMDIEDLFTEEVEVQVYE